MIASLAKLIDWLFIQKSCGRTPAFDRQAFRLDEAIQFLNGPNFFSDESQPARIEFGSDKSAVDFRFPTPRPSSFAENNIAYGRLYRCEESWQKRPTIVLLHGGSMMRGRRRSLGYRFGYPRLARRCNSAGFNAVTLELPYHFQRHPRQSDAAKNMDYLRMAEAVAQAIAEIRALIGWLLQEGCPAVALWGVSMGGSLAGLTVCRDARLSAVVMTVPTVRSNPSYADRILKRSVREAWRTVCQAEEELDTTPLNLTSSKPVIPKENILLIGGIHDLVCPMKPIEELWQLWGQPDLWRLPHGHISFMGQLDLTSRVLRWLSPRLNASLGRETTNQRCR